MTNIDELRPYIHLHSSDPRFCGSTLPIRQFTVDDAKVTCPRCQYQALKKQGHSASKAAEIVLDASRGDLYAQQWVKLALA